MVDWTGCSSRQALVWACCTVSLAGACGRTNLGAILVDDGSAGAGGVGASSASGTGGLGTGGTVPGSGGGLNGGDAGAGGAAISTGGTGFGTGGAGINTGGAGGKAINTGGAVNAGGSAGAVIETALPDGSFDLVFDEFYLEGRPSSAPLVGFLLRVDLFDRGFGLQGLVTPRWGEAVPVAVRVEGLTLVLVGDSVVVEDPGEFWGFEDSLGSIVLPIDREGRLVLGNGATGAGVERRGEDEVHPFEVLGRIDLDRTPPEIRSDSQSEYGPPSALLPWDPVVIRVAEPLSAPAIGDNIVLTPEGAPMAPISATFGYSPPDALLAFRGITVMTGQLKAWDGLLEGGDLAVTARPDVPDWSGNLLASDTRIEIPYVHLGIPVSNHTFTLDEEVARWGYTAWSGFPPELPCESSTCVQIGPVPDFSCDERSGIAGVLSTFSPAGASYRIDYSVRAEGPWPEGKVAFIVQTADFGAYAGETRVFGPELVNLGDGVGDLHYASGPLSVEISYPMGHVIPGAIGFGIFLASDVCDGGGPRYSVIVDYVEQ